MYYNIHFYFCDAREASLSERKDRIIIKTILFHANAGAKDKQTRKNEIMYRLKRNWTNYLYTKKSRKS